MPEFAIYGSTLQIASADGPQEIQFKWPITQVLTVGSTYIVRTEPPPGACANQNVHALDHEGRRVWTVSARNHVYADSPYTNIYLQDGELFLSNWDGLNLVVEPETWREIRATYGR